MTQVAGVDEIRSHFPALERLHTGVPVADFDGPAAFLSALANARVVGENRPHAPWFT